MQFGGQKNLWLIVKEEKHLFPFGFNHRSWWIVFNLLYIIFFLVRFKMNIDTNSIHFGLFVSGVKRKKQE